MNDNHDNGGENNQRDYPRVGFSSTVRIVVPDDDTAIDVVADNVSREGIFLKTDRSLVKGKKVSLEFNINKEIIRVDEGEVIWTTDADGMLSDTATVGIGVRFNKLSNGSKECIESFIEEELQKKTEQPVLIDTLRVGNEGGLPMVTRNPSPRRHWFIFSIFVVIVAVATFLTLYMIKPIGIGENQKLDMSSLPEVVESDTAQSKSHEESAPEKQPSETNTQVSPKVVPKTADAEKNDQSKENQQREKAPGSSKQVGISVQAPEFEKTSKGWKMTIQATGKVKTKHFQLKSPPRLVIDFNNAEYIGKETVLDNPISSILRVRIGEDPKHTRIVVDFRGDQAPVYRVVLQKDGVTVIF